MLDVLVRDGLLIDGLGGPRRQADVGIVGDRVVAIGALADRTAERVVDARGKIVAPGFIDIHSHSDWTLLVNRRAESSVRQGVTTEVIGNCGFSWATSSDPVRMREVVPAYARDHVAIDWTTFADYLSTLERGGVSINVAPLVGHGAIRVAGIGFAARAPAADEVTRMQAIAADALDSGAVGLSFGLQYAPGSSAERAELGALAEVAAARDKPVAVHMRDYAERILEAIDEMIEVAEASGARLQLSHVPPYERGAPEDAWGRAAERVERARSRGVDVAFDLHPYLWGMTLLNVLLPAWAFEGGVARTLERLRDAHERERIKCAPKPHFFARMLDEGRWDKLMLASARNSRQLVGKTLAEIGDELHREPYDAALDVLLEEGDALHDAWWLGQLYDEAIQAEVMRHPLSMIEADGMSLAVDGPLAGLGMHPRCFGWTARLLGYHVRDRGVLPLEEAIRKITSLPAERIGLADRGKLVAGARADVVVFDPATVHDNATYAQPAAYPTGFQDVLINGVPVLAAGTHSGAFAGEVIRH